MVSPRIIAVLRRRELLFFAAITLAVFCVGLFSRPSLCDEVFHFDFAKQVADSGHRPLFSPRLHSLPEFDGYRVFEQGPLLGWVIGQIWRAVGGGARIIAHIVQTSFFILAITGTYVLAKDLYDRSTASWAVLLMMATPATLLFGILLQPDLPVASLMPWIVWLALRRRYLLIGLLLGLGWLLKRNMACFAPVAIAVLFVTWFAPQRIRGLPPKRPPSLAHIVTALACVVVIGGLTILPDIIFRLKEFGTVIHWAPVPRAYQHTRRFKDPQEAMLVLSGRAESAGQAEGIPPRHYSVYVYEDVSRNPWRLPQFMGVVLLAALPLWAFDRFMGLRLRRALIPLLATVAYAGTWIAVTKARPGSVFGIRYYVPIIPFLSILAATIVLNGGRVRRAVVLAICLAQIAAVLPYVYFHRRLDAPSREVIGFLDKHAEPEERVLSPILHLPYMAGCTAVWDRPASLGLLDHLFTAKDPERITSMLQKVGIVYVLVPADRVYPDDLDIAAGYPQSFLDLLRKAGDVRLALRNRQFTLWEVKPPGGATRPAPDQPPKN